ncbi:MAG: carboxypeptidase regulatory-like domain-containing protein [Vicinamibacterales bacterium]
MLAVSVVLAALLGLAGQEAPSSTAVVSGVVLDEVTRSPVAGAQVLLARHGEAPPAAFHEPRFFTTGPDGRFAFEGVPPGAYLVHADRSGYARRSASLVLPRDAGPAGALDLAMARVGLLVGRVVDESGRPVAGAYVSPLRRLIRRPGAVSAGGRPVPPFDPIPGSQTSTEDDGRFTIGNLPAGEYAVSVRGGRPASTQDAGTGYASSFVRVYYPGTTDPDAALAVTTGASGTVDLGDIRLPTVPAFRVRGVVLDEAGRPLDRVRVRLVPEDAPRDRLPLTAPVELTTSDGVFALDRVLPGRYLVVAVPPVTLAAAPAPAGSYSERSMAAGRSAESARGSVTVETRDGVTRRYADERATLVPLEVVDRPMELVVTLARRQ